MTDKPDWAEKLVNSIDCSDLSEKEPRFLVADLIRVFHGIKKTGRIAGIGEAADRFRVASLVALLTQEQADEIEKYIRDLAVQIKEGKVP